MKTKTSFPFVILLTGCLIVFLVSSCAQPFKECVSQWTQCKNSCPEVNEMAWQECLSNCDAPSVPPNEDPEAWEAFNKCLRACGNPFTARELCLEQCDKDLQECVNGL